MSLTHHAFQTDPKVWKEPYKFNIDRFDSSSEWSKMPNGKTRPASMWTPFGYGPRMCAGYSLAMNELKCVFIYYMLKFDYEMADQKQRETDQMLFNMTSLNKLNLKLTKVRD